MKTNIFLIFGLIVIVFTSCNKDLEDKPKISFIKAKGYTFSNSHYKYGDSSKVGIHAYSVGEGNRLSKFEIIKEVKKEDSLLYEMTINREQLDLDFYIIHDEADTIVYKFYVYDKYFNPSFLRLENYVDKLPVIKFKSDTGYTGRDTTLTIGDSIKVGIFCKSVVDSINLKNFSIIKNTFGKLDTTINYFDTIITGIEFEHDFYFEQDTSDTIKWIFYINDEVMDTSFISIQTSINDEQ